LAQVTRLPRKERAATCLRRNGLGAFFWYRFTGLVLQFGTKMS
jgi:hypothetical protein